MTNSTVISVNWGIEQNPLELSWARAGDMQANIIFRTANTEILIMPAPDVDFLPARLPSRSGTVIGNSAYLIVCERL